MGVYKVNQTDGSLARVAGGTLYADAPIGAIQSYGGETAPAGWLICDGSTLSRTDYAELFAVIGINFGEGDGETTFGIPDLRECVPVGAGKNLTKSIANHDRYNLGQFKDDALGTHDHPLKTVTTATYNTAGVPVGVAVNNTPTSATHGKQLGVNYIIKAKQVAVPFDVAEYVRNQNVLSSPESVNLSDKQHVMEYDGIFTFSIYAFNASQRVKVSINDVLVINANLINYPSGQAYNSYTVHANKGDTITIDTTINLFDTITAQYYKLRDYSGR